MIVTYCCTLSAVLRGCIYVFPVAQGESTDNAIEKSVKGCTAIYTRVIDICTLLDQQSRNIVIA